MRALRTIVIASLLALIGVVGVVAALVTASIAEWELPTGFLVGFAFLYCAGPAAVLAWLAFGGVHLVERLWPRLTSAGVLAAGAARGRSALGRFRRRALLGASGPASFRASVALPATPPPSPVILGVCVAVPLAFLNVPGWLAVQFGVVEGLGAAAAIFVVPGLVCGALVGGLIRGLRQQA